MQIVIPMAGSGARFIAAGYKEPKPLITLTCDHRRILEHVLDMFQEPDDEFIFICNEDHLLETNMGDELYRLRPDSNIISIPPHKKGPVYTLQPALSFLRPDEPVIVAYCDGTLKWNRQDFQQKVQGLDGCILTHTGFHPHTLSTTKMAFVKEVQGRVVEVKEKASYTDNPWNEHASSGIYYFSKASYLKKYSARMFERNLHYGGEFYVTLLYNPMIENGLKVGYYDTEFVAILGTPEDVLNFEAWATLVKNTRISSDEDIVRCFNYWKRYWKLK